jgi:hypothetical protein
VDTDCGREIAALEEEPWKGVGQLVKPFRVSKRTGSWDRGMGDETDLR